jgi:hypothetical protein
MKNKDKLQAAKKATDKLNAYSDGVHAAGGKDATNKYHELNSKADKAIKDLPAHLRSRVVIENLGK